jgi:Tol biopolymer transport system component
MAEESQPKAIYLLNLTTRQITQLKGSEGLFSPRWSPDGRSIAALSIDQKSLMLYDIKTQTWRLLTQHNVADPIWSRRGETIFFHDFAEEGQPIFKVIIATGKVEQIADFHDLRPANAVDYRFAGLAPGDIPLVAARTSTANIYSAELPER